MPDAQTTEIPQTIYRTSPLASILTPGLFGASRGVPSVNLSVRHPASIVTVIARKSRADDLTTALNQLQNCAVHWAGFEQFYVVAEGLAEGALYLELKDKLNGIASVSEQSHARVIIRVSGPRSRSVLAKGTPVDLHAHEFPVGACAVTQMAHIGIHMVRTGGDAFEISVPRGFAESFWKWLAQQSEEFGYQVR